MQSGKEILGTFAYFASLRETNTIVQNKCFELVSLTGKNDIFHYYLPAKAQG